WTRGVGLARQRDELLVVTNRLRAVAGRLGGARRAVETAIAVRIFLEGALELAQRRRRLPLLEQELAEQLTHRVEPILHRHVLHAAVLAVGRGAHELQSLIAI